MCTCSVRFVYWTHTANQNSIKCKVLLIVNLTEGILKVSYISFIINVNSFVSRL